MPDKLITCYACENTFIFKESEQKRYATLGFEEPKRCTECRSKKRKSVQEQSRKERNKRSSGRRVRGEDEDANEYMKSFR